MCGAGCMGFVNVARGLRAIGYTERDPLPAGPVALVTHSGSVFSALLRTRRAFGFTVAVSSGQELVTQAAAYARYALTLPETKVLALVLEAIRDAGLPRAALADAAARDIPVVLLTAGASAASRSLVAARSGALATGDGAWQALAAVKASGTFLPRRRIASPAARAGRAGHGGRPRCAPASSPAPTFSTCSATTASPLSRPVRRARSRPRSRPPRRLATPSILVVNCPGRCAKRRIPPVVARAAGRGGRVRGSFP